MKVWPSSPRTFTILMAVKIDIEQRNFYKVGSLDPTFFKKKKQPCGYTSSRCYYYPRKSRGRNGKWRSLPPNQNPPVASQPATSPLSHQGQPTHLWGTYSRFLFTEFCSRPGRVRYLVFGGRLGGWDDLAQFRFRTRQDEKVGMAMTSHTHTHSLFLVSSSST